MTGVCSPLTWDYIWKQSRPRPGKWSKMGKLISIFQQPHCDHACAMTPCWNSPSRPLTQNPAPRVHGFSADLTLRCSFTWGAAVVASSRCSSAGSSCTFCSPFLQCDPFVSASLCFHFSLYTSFCFFYHGLALLLMGTEASGLQSVCSEPRGLPWPFTIFNITFMMEVELVQPYIQGVKCKVKVIHLTFLISFKLI